VEFLGKSEATCIEVDSANKLYVCENMIPTHNTASGLSMLMNSAAKGLRRAISSIDSNVIAPTILQTFVHEMVYNEDETIKGDCNIVPRGAAAILIRESAQQRRIQFLGMTANPIDMQILGVKGRAALLRETATAMELPVDEVVPDDEALDQQQQAQAQQAQAQAQAMQQAEMQKAQMEQQNMQAKEAAIGEREQQHQQTKTIGDIAKIAAQSGLQSRQPQTTRALQ
jgi:hypothetical protein